MKAPIILPTRRNNRVTKCNKSWQIFFAAIMCTLKLRSISSNIHDSPCRVVVSGWLVHSCHETHNVSIPLLTFAYMASGFIIYQLTLCVHSVFPSTFLHFAENCWLLQLNLLDTKTFSILFHFNVCPSSSHILSTNETGGFKIFTNTLYGQM